MKLKKKVAAVVVEPAEVVVAVAGKSLKLRTQLETQVNLQKTQKVINRGKAFR